MRKTVKHTFNFTNAQRKVLHSLPNVCDEGILYYASILMSDYVAPMVHLGTMNRSSPALTEDIYLRFDGEKLFLVAISRRQHIIHEMGYDTGDYSLEGISQEYAIPLWDNPEIGRRLPFEWVANCKDDIQIFLFELKSYLTAGMVADVVRGLEMLLAELEDDSEEDIDLDDTEILLS